MKRTVIEMYIYIITLPNTFGIFALNQATKNVNINNFNYMAFN